MSAQSNAGESQVRSSGLMLRPLRHKAVILPLLSFGAGTADGFAYLVLGGIFTANMTGNAVLAVVFDKPGYPAVVAGGLTAIGAFAAALMFGFRVTRKQRLDSTRRALALAALCHCLVVVLWWCAPHGGGTVLVLIASSAAAMGLQTVATKRDGVSHGPTTTYATGTLTDLVSDIVDGTVSWTSTRWLTLFALPGGAAVAVATARWWPEGTPLLPLLATTACIALLSGNRGSAPADGMAER